MYIIFGIVLINFAFLIDIRSLNYLQPVYNNGSLEKGIIFEKYDNGPLIIMGHSGIGPAAVFNDLIDLLPKDEIIIHTLGERVSYYVYDKKIVKKNNSLILEKNSTILYLVTCDLKDYDMQWLILAKIMEEG